MQHQLILCHLAKKAKQMYNQKKNPSIMPQTGHRHKCGLSQQSQEHTGVRENTVAFVNVLCTRMEHKWKHVRSSLTSNIGLALSWTDRMCVTLFLLNCSASLASVIEERGWIIQYFLQSLARKNHKMTCIFLSWNSITDHTQNNLDLRSLGLSLLCIL